MEFRARPSVVRVRLAGPTDGLPPKGSCHHRTDGRCWPRQTNPPRAQFHATSDANDWHVHPPAARPEPGTADALFLFSFLIPGSFIRGIDWTRLLLCAATFNPVPLSLPRSLVVSSPSDGACVHAGEQKKCLFLISHCGSLLGRGRVDCAEARQQEHSDLLNLIFINP